MSAQPYQPPRPFPSQNNKKPNYQKRKGRDFGPNRNERIRSPQIRVIGPEGNQIGVMPPREALEIAKRYGLDLIEISPQARPPVCRIMNYGKYKYEESKKANSKKGPTAKLKEVQLTVSIDAHDFFTKLKNAERFLNAGNKLKVILKFKGREMEFKPRGFDLVNRAITELNLIGSPDAPPKLAGRNITVMLSPLPENKRKLKFNTKDDDLEVEDDEGNSSEDTLENKIDIEPDFDAQG